MGNGITRRGPTRLIFMPIGLWLSSFLKERAIYLPQPHEACRRHLIRGRSFVSWVDPLLSNLSNITQQIAQSQRLRR